MATLNPYLNFNGNTEEAFNFYREVFGGEFSNLQRFKDTPGQEKLSGDDKEKIMHIALPVGKNILMGTDALESMGHKLKMGDNIQLSLSPDSEEEANELFDALAQGGKIQVPMGKASWGDFFGMLTDKYNVNWMINYSMPKDKKHAHAEEEVGDFAQI